MFLESRTRTAREADNLTASCEPIVWTVWEPQRLITLWASTACYWIALLSLFIYWHNKNRHSLSPSVLGTIFKAYPVKREGTMRREYKSQLGSELSI
jgi:hypothetical protein